MIAIRDRSRQNRCCELAVGASGEHGLRAGRFLSASTEPGIGAMSCSREEVDLEIALKNPERARKYVLEFDWGLPDPPKYVVWGLEEKIYFDNMNDEEAVVAAFIILRDVDIPQNWRTSEMLEFELH
jgi:hypothetical protein